MSNELESCHCKFSQVTLNLLFCELPVHLLGLFSYRVILAERADWAVLCVKQGTNLLSVIDGKQFLLSYFAHGIYFCHTEIVHFYGVKRISSFGVRVSRST